MPSGIPAKEDDIYLHFYSALLVHTVHVACEAEMQTKSFVLYTNACEGISQLDN